MPLSEEFRTIMLCCLFAGIWVPPMWLPMSIVTVVKLKDAPPSWHHTGIKVLVFLVPLWFLVFVGTLFGIAVEKDNTENYDQAISAASLFLLVAYGALCSMFIAWSDMTYRSTRAPLPVSRDWSPIYIRGFNLACGLAALFLLNAVVSVVSIPLLLRRLKPLRNEAAGYGNAEGVGIASFVSGVCVLVMLLICIIMDIALAPAAQDGSRMATFAILWVDPFWIAPVLLIIAVILHFALHVAFVILVNRMAYRLLPPEPQAHAGGGVTLTQACPACKVSLSFQSTGGSATQVVCYACKATVEFATKTI
jgi:hypothetical protein